MPRLQVNRFNQDAGCCAIAASACVSNYWDSNKNYDIAKQITYKEIIRKAEEKGLHSGEICLLLNKMGFNKVTLVSSSMDVFDYSWQDYNKSKMIKVLEESLEQKTVSEEKKQTKLILKWLKDTNYNNQIIIDYNFGKYIREFIRSKKPLIVSFNWTIFFRYYKADCENKADTFNGSAEWHAAVIYGYDSKGVHICDSHNALYTYKRKKYRSGFYKMSWENLMTVIGEGDIFLPEQYGI